MTKSSSAGGCSLVQILWCAPSAPLTPRFGVKGCLDWKQCIRCPRVLAGETFARRYDCSSCSCTSSLLNASEGEHASWIGRQRRDCRTDRQKASHRYGFEGDLSE